MQDEKRFVWTGRRPMRHFGILGCLITCILVVHSTGCHQVKALPPPPNANCSQENPAIQVDIYHDFTKSMQGFLTPARRQAPTTLQGPGRGQDSTRDTPYETLLEVVERAAIAVSTQKPTFWKFGTQVDAMEDRHERFSRAAYEPRDGYFDNNYQVVIDHSINDGQAHLQVILTDLFQSDNDIEAVSESILSRFFPGTKAENNFRESTTASPIPGAEKNVALKDRPASKMTASRPEDNAFGLLGIKLPFNGMIYDVGRARDNLYWNNARPVYVLILGPRSDVQHYLSLLKGEIAHASLGDSQEVVITPELVKCLPRVDRLPLESPSRIDQVQSLMTVREHPLVKQLRIPRRTTQSEFTLNIPVEFLASGLQPTPEDIAARIAITRGQSDGRNEFESAPEATDSIQIAASLKTAEKRPQNITLKVKVDASRLQQDRIYRAEVSVGPQRQKIQFPQWIDEWSTTAAVKPDGAKTLNLSPFITDLWNGMTITKEPELVHIFFYFRKE